MAIAREGISIHQGSETTSKDLVEEYKWDHVNEEVRWTMPSLPEKQRGFVTQVSMGAVGTRNKARLCAPITNGRGYLDLVPGHLLTAEATAEQFGYERHDMESLAC
jgi:hypothetical protein